MFKSVAILGRQPALGIAELESLYGPDTVQPFGGQACLVDVEACNIDFNRIGGSTRLATILLELPLHSSWKSIEKFLVEEAPEKALQSDGKISFGISVFGMKVSAKQVAKTALLVKKAIRSSGKSVRMVPHNDSPLNSASVLHNKLYKDGNWELLIVSDGTRSFLAQTHFIQDIDAYTARDRERPMRDAKVGMLPPKLAQIIINLASSPIYLATSAPGEKTLLLDPFCGTGVTLQEAMLMDYDVYGTDIEPRMIDYSIANMAWLDTLYPDVGDYRRIEMGDATKHRWHNADKITLVAGETYLGKPLNSLPPGDQLSKIIYDANLINHRFLQNIHGQLRSGTRLCLGIPTWRGKHEFLHLPMLDHLTEMGYTRIKFKHVRNEDLVYHREGQVVGRELLVLEKR
jgi:tRNA G10  N-methylase Trm11